MCKSRRNEQRPTAPATGSTTRLSDGEPDNSIQYTASRAQSWRGAHFPWWTLWLIWPLIGVAKAVAPAMADAWVWISQVTVPLLPAILIVLGAALLLARRRDSRAD